MMLRFEIARQIGSGSSGLFKPDVPNAVDQPAFPLIANSLYFNGLRQTLGTTVFSGMIGVTIFGLIFTPVFYVVSRWFALRFARRRR